MEVKPSEKYLAAREAENYYKRAIAFLSYSIKDRNSVLAESIILSYLFKVIAATRGPNFEQIQLMSFLLNTGFDYDTDLLVLLHDKFEEHYSEFLEYLNEHRNTDFTSDLYALSEKLISISDTPDSKEAKEVLKMLSE